MAKVIDITEVAIVMAAMRTRTEGMREDGGTKGVIVRLQYDVAPELTFWRVRELNRGTPMPEMQEAIITFFAATIMAEIRQVTDDRDDQFILINEVLKGFANALGCAVADQEKLQKNAVVIEGHEQH